MISTWILLLYDCGFFFLPISLFLILEDILYTFLENGNTFYIRARLLLPLQEHSEIRCLKSIPFLRFTCRGAAYNPILGVRKGKGEEKLFVDRAQQNFLYT